MSDPLDDEIDALARALRDETDGTSKDADRTLRAILFAPAPRPAASTWMLAAAVILTALLLGAPSAWAWWTGRPTSWAESEDTEARAREDELPALEPRAITALPSPPSAPVEEEPRAVAVAGLPSASDPVMAPPLRLHRDVAPPPDHVAFDSEREVDPPLEAGAMLVDPAERRAYETAHALHFEAGAPESALGAWDAYLAEYPDGRFSYEARYNRALSLVRLGRRAEARAALSPFAEGVHGEYWRREATELIDALDAAP